MRIYFICCFLLLVLGCKSKLATGDPNLVEDQRVKALLEKINDSPYHVRGDYSAGVQRLIEVGPAVMDHGLFELLLDRDFNTRMRAQTVLIHVSRDYIGLDRKLDDVEKERELVKQWQLLWIKNGDYEWNSPELKRIESYRKWLVWWMATKW